MQKHKYDEYIEWIPLPGVITFLAGCILLIISLVFPTLGIIGAIFVIVGVLLGIYLSVLLEFLKTKNSLKRQFIVYITLGISLAMIGMISVVVLTFFVDKQTPITVNYLTNQAVEGNLQINRPILSTSPEPPPQPWFFFEQVLAIIGVIVAFPLLVIQYLVQEINNFIKWVITGVIAIVILCGTLLGIPINQDGKSTLPTSTPSANNTTSLPPAIFSHPLKPDESIYYASIDVIAPPYLKQGQSQIVELNFRLMDSFVSEATPIILTKSNAYTASVDTQLVNFDLSSPPQAVQQDRLIELNNPVKWQWVLTPKIDAEGQQTIIWNLQIKDSQGKTYQDIPTVQVKVDIKPKLGIPSWILGSNFTFGALVSGILLNWLGYRAKRKNDDQEEWIKSHSSCFVLLIINPRYGALIAPAEEIPLPCYIYVPPKESIEQRSLSTFEPDIAHWTKWNLSLDVYSVSIKKYKTLANSYFVLCFTNTEGFFSFDFNNYLKYRWVLNFEEEVDKTLFYKKAVDENLVDLASIKNLLDSNLPKVSGPSNISEKRIKRDRDGD